MFISASPLISCSIEARPFPHILRTHLPNVQQIQAPHEPRCSRPCDEIGEPSHQERPTTAHLHCTHKSDTLACTCLRKCILPNHRASCFFGTLPPLVYLLRTPFWAPTPLTLVEVVGAVT